MTYPNFHSNLPRATVSSHNEFHLIDVAYKYNLHWRWVESLDNISACEVSSKDVGKIDWYKTTWKHNKSQTVCISFGIPSSLYIRRSLVGNKVVDHSDVVGASPAGTAPTTSSFST